MNRPLKYSNKQKDESLRYFLCGAFALLAIFFLGFGIYLVSFQNDWWVMYFIIPISLVMGIISISFFPRDQKNIYQMSLQEDGIHEYMHDETTGKTSKQFIPFEQMHYLLIGMYSHKEERSDGGIIYHYHALLIIEHDHGYFFQRIETAKELYEWTRRLYLHILDIRYTTYDLRRAVQKHFNEPIDFYKVPSSKENNVSQLIGTSSQTYELKEWLP